MDRYSQLRNSLDILASPFESQMKYLESIGHFDNSIVSFDVDDCFNVDEIALQFDDISYIVDDMIKKGEISFDQGQRVKELREHIFTYGNINSNYHT